MIYLEIVSTPSDKRRRVLLFKPKTSKPLLAMRNEYDSADKSLTPLVPPTKSHEKYPLVSDQNSAMIRETG